MAKTAPHIIGLEDMAVMFGMGHRSVSPWRSRKVLPEPLRIVGKTPIWEYDTIVEWARETGRTVVHPIPAPKR